MGPVHSGPRRAFHPRRVAAAERARGVRGMPSPRGGGNEPAGQGPEQPPPADGPATAGGGPGPDHGPGREPEPRSGPERDDDALSMQRQILKLQPGRRLEIVRASEEWRQAVAELAVVVLRRHGVDASGDAWREGLLARLNAAETTLRAMLIHRYYQTDVLGKDEVEKAFVQVVRPFRRQLADDDLHRLIDESRKPE